MYKDILKALYCPVCKAKFSLEERELENDEITEGTLVCSNAHRYAIRRGVIDFCSNEQEGFNQWGEAYKENTYEELDRKIELEKPEKEKEQQRMHLNAIAQEAARLERGYIVDIASGRGMLLTKLAETVKDSVSLIATDLSFDVLMYDRMKIKKINPNLHVSYIACDATAMPLETGFSDMTVSFYGVANMVGIVEAGIKEAARITNAGGKFLNAFIVIREDSKGFEVIKEICAEHHMPGAERTTLSEVVKELHNRYFSEVLEHIIVEDIREDTENKLDLLPYRGEWFAYVTYEGKK